MFAYIPAVIVSGLMHVLAPNVTDYASAVTLAVTLTIRDFELAQRVFRHCLVVIVSNAPLRSLYTYHLPVLPDFPTLSTLHSLSDRALAEVERGLDLTSPTDLVYYTAPIGAYSWDSSPNLRSHTHAAFSFARDTSSTACGTVSEVLYASLDFIIPGLTLRSTGYPSLSNTTPYSFFNITSTTHELPRPVFGPEWEWAPRDLVVYVPQPSCPVPQLTLDMSTASGLGRCGLGPERYTPMDVAAFPLPPLPVPGSLDLFDALEALDMLGWPSSLDSPQSANPIGTLSWSMALVMLRLVRLARYYVMALVFIGQACVYICRGLFCDHGEPNERYNFDLAADKGRLDACDTASNLDLPIAFGELPAVRLAITEVGHDPASRDEAEVDGEQAETSLSEQTPATLVLEDLSETIVEKLAQDLVDKSKTIDHDNRDNHEQLEILPRLPVVRFEEDIFESTFVLVTTLARQKREDRRQDRLQRAAFKTEPPSNANKTASDPSHNKAGTNKKAQEGRRVGAGGAGDVGGNHSARTRGGGIPNGGGEGGSVPKSGRYTQSESGQDRRWAGKDVGMLHVGFVGEVLVLEGAALKGGRRRRK